MPRVAFVLLLAIGGTGCRPANDDSPGIDAADRTATPGQATPSRSNDDADDANVLTRYDCNAGTSVALLRDGGARVALPDGKRIALERIAGSEPVVFTGSSLYFTLGERDAHLSQLDETNELACTKSDAVSSG